jgi:hypothetical protein
MGNIMDEDKKKRLKSAGWTIGSASEFLGLNLEEGDGRPPNFRYQISCSTCRYFKREYNCIALEYYDCTKYETADINETSLCDDHEVH